MSFGPITSVVGGATGAIFPVGTIIPAFESLPLHERAQAAVKVLRDVNDRANYGTVTAYSANDLQKLADGWRAADEARAKRENAIQELARDLFEAQYPLAMKAENPSTFERCQLAARKLYDAGYRKSGGDQ